MTEEEFYKIQAGLINWNKWPRKYQGWNLYTYNDKSGRPRYFASNVRESIPGNAGFLYLHRLLARIDELL